MELCRTKLMHTDLKRTSVAPNTTIRQCRPLGWLYRTSVVFDLSSNLKSESVPSRIDKHSSANVIFIIPNTNSIRFDRRCTFVLYLNTLNSCSIHTHTECQTGKLDVYRESLAVNFDCFVKYLSLFPVHVWGSVSFRM